MTKDSIISANLVRSTSKQQRLKIQALIVVFGCLLYFLCLGSLFAFGNIAPYLASYMAYTDLDSDTSLYCQPGSSDSSSIVSDKYKSFSKDVVWIYTAAVCTFAIFCPFGGKMELKFGPRAVSFVSAVGITASTAINYYLCDNFTYILISFGIIYGAIGGIAYTAPVLCALRWWPHRRATASSMVTLGYGCATVWVDFVETWYLNPNNDEIDEDTGYVCSTNIMERFPGVWLLLGGIFFIVMGFACILISNPPKGYGLETTVIDVTDVKSKNEIKKKIQEARKSSQNSQQSQQSHHSQHSQQSTTQSHGSRFSGNTYALKSQSGTSGMITSDSSDTTNDNAGFGVVLSPVVEIGSEKSFSDRENIGTPGNYTNYNNYNNYNGNNYNNYNYGGYSSIARNTNAMYNTHLSQSQKNLVDMAGYAVLPPQSVDGDSYSSGDDDTDDFIATQYDNDTGKGMIGDNNHSLGSVGSVESRQGLVRGQMQKHMGSGQQRYVEVNRSHTSGQIVSQSDKNRSGGGNSGDKKGRIPLLNKDSFDGGLKYSLGAAPVRAGTSDGGAYDNDMTLGNSMDMTVEDVDINDDDGYTYNDDFDDNIEERRRNERLQQGYDG